MERQHAEQNGTFVRKGKKLLRERRRYFFACKKNVDVVDFHIISRIFNLAPELTKNDVGNTEGCYLTSVLPTPECDLLDHLQQCTYPVFYFQGC